VNPLAGRCGGPLRRMCGRGGWWRHWGGHGRHRPRGRNSSGRGAWNDDLLTSSNGCRRADVVCSHKGRSRDAVALRDSIDRVAGTNRDGGSPACPPIRTRQCLARRARDGTGRVWPWAALHAGGGIILAARRVVWASGRIVRSVRRVLGAARGVARRLRRVLAPPRGIFAYSPWGIVRWGVLGGSGRIVRRGIVRLPRGIIGGPRRIIGPPRPILGSPRVPCARTITIVARPASRAGGRHRLRAKWLSVDAPDRCALRRRHRTGHFRPRAAGCVRIRKRIIEPG
jgi:hypothetical protein